MKTLFYESKFHDEGNRQVDYKIRKRLYSFNRLKKLLLNFNFDIIKKTATFFFQKKIFFIIFGLV